MPKYCCWECMVQLLWKTIWRFLKEPNHLNINLSYDSVIPLLYPRGLKIYVDRKTSACKFIALLLTIAKKWKKHSCALPDDERINKMWSIFTMEYCLAIKKNKILIPVTTWMNNGNIILSEGS